MARRIYVGKLLPKYTENQVRKQLDSFGTVETVNMKGNQTAQVSMSDGADEAITALNGRSIEGSNLQLREL